jgi:hypothetical protein
MAGCLDRLSFSPSEAAALSQDESDLAFALLVERKPRAQAGKI